MAYSGPVVACLVVHSYSVVEDGDFDSEHANEHVVVARAKIAVVVLVVVVALSDSRKPMGSEVVQHVVVDVGTAYYLAHCSLDNP